MHLPQVKALHALADATGDGVVLYDPEWRLNDRTRRDEITLEVIDNGVTSFSIQPKQSNDNTVWYNLGSPISAAGLTEVTGINMPYFKAEITAIVNNGSNIDVNGS